MPKLFHLHIENFRGIKKFDHSFNGGMTCIIGRGDSGKTTILDAISYVLSPLYTIPITDSDFHNCNVDSPIKIEATLTELTEEILRKVGDRIRGVKNGEIITSMTSPEVQEGVTEAITIQLKVEKDLEPEWYLLGADGIEPKPIRASERELFNCFYISEYNDRHFTLSKGTPLSSLFKQKAEKKKDVLNTELIAELGRHAKQGFEDAIQDKDVFQDVIDAITENASHLGLQSTAVKASIDQREFLLRENKIALHQEDNVPLRQLGKGSKRLLSLAIQLSLTEPSGIILIDEIEQGLEPDRVQQITTFLRDRTSLQIILTTHCIHVIQSLRTDNIVIKKNDAAEFKLIPSTIQGTIIKHPGSLFAKRIIVAEGGTEWGFIQGMNEFRQSCSLPSFSFNGIVLIDGNGDECFQTSLALCSLGYPILLFCDSDKQNLEDTKRSLRTHGVEIIDCEENLAFEHQIFKNCHWDTVKELINLRIESSGQSDKSIYNAIKQRSPFLDSYTEKWKEAESENLRQAIGIDADKSKWFKSKELGKAVAKIIMPDSKRIGGRLAQNLTSFLEWLERT